MFILLCTLRLLRFPFHNLGTLNSANQWCDSCKLLLAAGLSRYSRHTVLSQPVNILFLIAHLQYLHQCSESTIFRVRSLLLHILHLLVDLLRFLLSLHPPVFLRLRQKARIHLQFYQTVSVPGAVLHQVYQQTQTLHARAHTHTQTVVTTCMYQCFYCCMVLINSDAMPVF